MKNGIDSGHLLFIIFTPIGIAYKTAYIYSRIQILI